MSQNNHFKPKIAFYSKFFHHHTTNFSPPLDLRLGCWGRIGRIGGLGGCVGLVVVFWNRDMIMVMFVMLGNEYVAGTRLLMAWCVWPLANMNNTSCLAVQKFKASFWCWWMMQHAHKGSNLLFKALFGFYSPALWHYFALFESIKLLTLETGAILSDCQHTFAAGPAVGCCCVLGAGC